MKRVLFNLINAAGRTLRGRGLGLERIPFLRRIYVSTYHKVAPDDVALVQVQNNQMYVNPQDEPLGRSLATEGIYEGYETSLFRSFVKGGMTVIDIGANVGYYTLIAAELVGETGKVFAFEPEPGNFDLLSRNIRLNNYANVDAVQKAVSKGTESITLYIDRGNFGNRSLAKGNILVDGGAVEIETVSLDEFCASHLNGRRLDVLKIDAQGAEGLILMGAKETLKEYAPTIFMEFEPEMLRNIGTDPVDLLDDFSALGYHFRLLDYQTKSLLTLKPADLLEECKKNGYVDLLLEPTTSESIA
jgi:FkbM family methyltransferase